MFADSFDDLMDLEDSLRDMMQQQAALDLDEEMWRTNDERRIPIRLIGDQHLTNIIKMLRRGHPYLDVFLPRLEDEASSRGLQI